MSTFRDICINLVSNAIWAIGGYMTTRFLLFKKAIQVRLLQGFERLFKTL